VASGSVALLHPLAIIFFCAAESSSNVEKQRSRTLNYPSVISEICVLECAQRKIFIDRIEK